MIGTRRLFFVLTAVLCCLNMTAQVRVADAENAAPVPYANVYNAAGNFLGTTDADGLLPRQALREASIAVSHINYQSETVLTDTLRCGTIALRPITYRIGDVDVSTESLDYIRVSTYVRQYQIADSLPVSYSEGIYDFYFPRKNGRAKRHTVAAREVMREDILNDDGDASFYSNTPPKMERKPSALSAAQKLAQSGRDTINRENAKSFGAKITASYNKERGTCELYGDSAFSEKPFTFNLLGIHFQVTGYRYGYIYDISAGVPTFDKLQRSYDNWKMRLWFDGRKGHVTEAEEFSEMFVLASGYVSKAQMKEAMRRETQATVAVPPDIPALPKPLADAVARMRPAK